MVGAARSPRRAARHAVRAEIPIVTMEDVLLQHELEQFFYAEAAVLDARRYEEWLTFFTDDLEYWMPVRSTRAADDEEHEFAKLGEGAFFDEDKASMEQRVRKVRTGFAWAEDPPSRTRHYVNNVSVLERLSESELKVGCNFALFRSRLGNQNDFWAGRREDTLRRNEGQWKIAKRHIFLDHVTLDSKNLSSFF
jgi:3-phenylpropionate/cinnamic acid dioxygenase small subunit